MTRPRPQRNWNAVGHVATFALLGAIGYALLRLHPQPWWNGAPSQQRILYAALATGSYAAACLWLWGRGRRGARRTGKQGDAPLLLAWASQTGFAQQLALHSAAALRAAGQAVRVLPLQNVTAADLAGATQALFVVSTSGEGDPPDHALPFLRKTMAQSQALPQLSYALLALGDRRYDHFCAFGRQLDAWLRQHGAHPLFDRIDVDNADDAALRHWQQLLGQLAGGSEQPDWSPPAYQRWQLQQRRLCNPGSVGGAVFELALLPADGALPAWQAGDLVEIGPCHGDSVVQAWLQASGVDGTATLQRPGQAPTTLAALLARSHLPEPEQLAGTAPAAVAARLQPLPHREYSIASMPSDGALRLLLRRALHADGTPGLGSGWLCDTAPIGAEIALRLRPNPHFHPPADPARPLILIGNGTGLAGLRAHLRARIDAGATRTWLLYGERHAAHDDHYGEELRTWLAHGALQRLDAVFSRDAGAHRYVQDALRAAAADLRDWVAQGAAIYVCGSLRGMAPGVDAVLEEVLGRLGKETLLLEGRYRRDVY
ncbi:sulfite reductase (NADPH) flavoprotein alpha-component [Xanthomonas sp. JAI131]|uniref:sulfite reductase subunit alpha n=1 Tax=Xanthomonas sp. JAI131 TaxID=2723067 RepID=UPI0015C7B02C|nr:sulfite reductase subunit alpha [Xanthomonas sp. JAI131]NYF20176.1 sulfite reductase (NADPH) flavoprotein alpha-component [Xanthomonas sp. JAI131]